MIEYTESYIDSRLPAFRARYSVNAATGCWEWHKNAMGAGYGSFCLFGRQMGAHVASYWLLRGEVPAGLFVLHACDNRRCVNPGHLFLGTQTDNMRDCAKKGRVVLTDVSGGKNPNARLT